MELSELVRLRRRLFRNGCWRLVDSFDRKYLNLTISVLQKNLADRVLSLKVRQLLGLIVAKIGSIRTLAIVRGRNILSSMMKNPTYRWAKPSIKRWVESANSHLTVGLHDMSLME